MKRDYQLDLIRVVAMFFVIFVHALPYASMPSIINSFLSFVLFSADGLFFMISGYFNLRKSFKTTEDYKTFYYKKFVTIVIPFLIVSLCIFLSENRNHLSLYSIKKLFTDFFTCGIYYHLWFVYYLIGFILVTPFISKMIENMSVSDIKIFFLICLAWNTINVIISSDIFNVDSELHGWVFYGHFFFYVAGYLLEKIKNSINYTRIYILGAIGLMIATIQYHLYPYKQVFNTSPFHIIAIISIYLFIKNKCIVNNTKLKKIIDFLVYYSFVIYLVHAKVLSVVCYYFPQLSNSYYNYIYISILTFAISLMHSIILNNLLFKPLTKKLLHQ